MPRCERTGVVPAGDGAPYYATYFAAADFGPGFPVKVGDWTVDDAPITRLHFHNYCEIGYCRDGSGVFVIAGKVKRFRAGDVSIINPSEPHFAQSVHGGTSRWSWISVDPIGLLSSVTADYTLIDPSPYWGEGFPNLFSRRTHSRLVEAVVRVIDELSAKRERYELSVRAHFLQVMVELSRMSDVRRREDGSAPSAPMERLMPAINAIAGGYSSRLPVDRLARRCFLSTVHFRRLFTRAMGKSPQRYILEVRVAMACGMLRGSTRPISDIAAHCGFPTLSSFNRAFRRMVGMPPRRWRSCVASAEQSD